VVCLYSCAKEVRDIAEYKITLSRKFNIFLLPLLLLIIYFLFYGFYDDAITESYWDAYMRGLLVKESSVGYVYIHLFTSYIYISLYKLFPYIPWYWVITIVFFYLVTVQLFYLLSILIDWKFSIKDFGLGIILILVFHLFWYENFLSYQFTKLVILLSGFSIMLLLERFRKEKLRFKNLPYFLINIMLFSFALLSRNQATYHVLLLLIVYAFLSGISYSRIAVVFSPLILLVILVACYFQFSNNEWVKQSNKVEPYIFTMLDAGYAHPLSEQKTHSDSVKYLGFQQWFFADRQVYTAEYLSTITYESIFTPEHLFHINWKEKLMDEAKKIDYALKRNVWLFLLNVCLFLILFKRIFNDEGSVFLRFAIYQLFFWSMIFGVAVLIKMEDRFLSPMLLVWTASNFMFVTINTKKQQKDLTVKKMFLYFVILSIVPAWKNYNTFKIVSRYEKKELNYVSQVWKETDSLFSGKIIVPDQYAAVQFSLTCPFRNPHFTKNNKILGYDMGYNTLYPPFVKELEQIIGSSQFDDFYKYLYHNKEKVVFMADEERLKWTKDYLRTIYNLRYDFRIIEPEATINNSEPAGIKDRVKFHYYVFE